MKSLPEEAAERLFRLAVGELLTLPAPVAPEQPISASPNNLRRFWVVQDAAELRDKFHINAELVLSSTVSRLERNCSLGRSLFQVYPHVVVSIDFIKSDAR